MNHFIITTDSTVDLPTEYLERNRNQVLSLSYIMDGEIYDDLHGLASGEFYDRMRNGALPTTSQFNPKEAVEMFKKILKEGVDILHIGFSSGLSGSFNSARIAAEELMEVYPERTIKVVDSLGASMGEGLLLYKANEWKQQGKSLEEIYILAEKLKLHICHNFTVDDLNHLHRGGRISKATAIIGTMVNMKPVLHMDEDGHLVSIGKVRGRKKSLLDLIDRMEEQMKGYENDIIMISHGDCEEDAQFVKQHVEERFGIHNFMIHPVGPVIGTHSGPGTIALFFVGKRV
ncbi:MAG: DegV family protein [Lachnospiraceae bacterium]